MPDLPTLTVTAAQAQRLIQVFAPGGTQAQAAENYKRWLKRTLMRMVLNAEHADIEDQGAQAKETVRSEVTSIFPDVDLQEDVSGKEPFTPPGVSNIPPPPPPKTPVTTEPGLEDRTGT